MGYLKGARSERALARKFKEKGFLVVRSAKSGVDGVSPDLLVLSTHKNFALECKAWKANNLSIEARKMQVMREWQAGTGIPFYIAWNFSRNWRFFPLDLMKPTPTGWSISQEEAECGLSFEEML